jgi:hypothetical protein
MKNRFTAEAKAIMTYEPSKKRGKSCGLEKRIFLQLLESSESNPAIEEKCQQKENLSF